MSRGMASTVSGKVSTVCWGRHLWCSLEGVYGVSSNASRCIVKGVYSVSWKASTVYLVMHLGVS